MPTEEVIHHLMKTTAGRFSVELGIKLEGAQANEIFKWFLASLLFGIRISETIVTKTYQVFARAQVLTPQAIQATGWDGLVALLDEGGYVRYDYKTATKLLEVTSQLEEKYHGDLNLLHRQAKTAEDLERLLREFKGVGPVTVNIFLRELRGIWKKADSPLAELALLAALDLGLISSKQAQSPNLSVRLLQKQWQQAAVASKKFSDLEAALVRLGKNYCRRNREGCPLKQFHVVK